MDKKFSQKYFIDHCLIIFFAFFINYYFGSIGVLPQDTFAYFDTGYRVLNGAAPFKDYWTVSGPFLDYFQAILFYLFGISWKSYILSGSLLNVLITIVLYHVFARHGLQRINNLFYCFCFSILANPSMGSPFTDHFSSFFSLAAILLFLLSIKENLIRYYLAIPFLFFIAFFSKQTPATYLFFSFILILFVYYSLYKKFPFIKYFIISSVLCVGIFFLFLIINSISLENFISQYILYPRTIGLERWKNYNLNINDILNNFKFLYLILIFVIANIFFQFKDKKIRKEKDKFIINFTLIVITISFIFHQVLTMNFIFIFFLIPLIAGFMHINYSKKNKYYFLISIFLISITLISTVKYHLRFNENRKMLNLEKVNLELSIDGKKIDKSLKGLKWITKNYSQDPAREIFFLNKMINLIQEDQNNIMLYSDYLFLSALINKDLKTPTRWPSQEDASNPTKDEKHHSIYIKFIKDLILKKNIEVIYSTIEARYDVFNLIFDKKCRKSEVITELLTKHDIRNCKIVK